MLRRGDWMDIQSQLSKGVYQKDIAANLGVHPKTIRRAIKRGGAPSGKRPKAHQSKLDPFKEQVDQLLAEGVWNAVVIFRELQQKGYKGAVTILRDYIRPKRPLRQSRATVRFETAPGKQMQNDWGQIETIVDGVATKVHFSVNALGYSRRFHFWCTDCEDAEHTYEGMIRAFEHFGGVAAEVLVDNQKSTVISHSNKGIVKFNERFLDLAGHYGFTARACRPYRARTKGKDERMVGYIKHHFFVRYRRFDSFAHMNQLAMQWLAQEADPRVHGTVKEVVSERFTREAPCLGPLASTRYDTSYHFSRLANWDGYIDVRGNRYSVPSELCGQAVSVRLSIDGRLSVFSNDRKIAEHRLKNPVDGWVTTPVHHINLWRDVCRVQRRDLSVYEEVIACN